MIINDDSIKKGIEIESKFAEIFQISPDAIAITRLKDGKYVDVNDGYLKLFGYSSEELIGNTATNLHIWKDPEELKSFKQNLLELGEVNNLEVLLLSKTGQTITCLISARRIELNGEIYNLSIARDISDRKQQEAALINSEERLSNIFDTLTEGVALNEMIFNEYREMVDYRILIINPAFYKVADYNNVGNVIGNTATKLYNMDVDTIKEFWRAHRDSSQPVHTEFISPINNRVFDITTSPFLNNRFVTSFQDITEQKKSIDSLRESEEKFRAIVENANDIIYTLSRDGTFTYVSQNWSSMLGHDLNEVMGYNYEKFVHPEDVYQCRNFLQEVINTGRKNSALEYRVKHKDGGWRWHTSNGSPLFDKEGKICSFMGIARDITEQKLLDERLHMEKTMLQQSQEQANLGSFAWDLCDNSLLWSPNMFTIHGLDQENFHGILFDEFTRLIHPGDLEKVRSEIQKMISAKQVWTMQFRVNRPDRSVRVMQFSGEFEFDSCGNPIKCIGIHQDITDWKEAEQKLWKSEERFRIIASNTPDHVIMQDKDLRYTFVLNPQLGLTEEDLIGKTDYDFLEQEEAGRLVKAKTHVLETGQPLEFETSLVSGQGNMEYFSGTFVPSFNNDGQIDGLIGYFRNVTKEKKAEAALSGEKQRLADIITATNAGTWEWNIQTGENIFNERWAEMIGYTLDEISPTTYDTWLKIVHTDDLKISSALQEKHFKGELDYYECELRMLHKNGHWIWVLDRGKVTQWTDDGRPLMMYGTHQDITQRKEAEEALRENQEMLSLFISNSPIYTFIKDVSATESRVLQVSDNYNQMIGIPSREMVGKTMEELFPPEFATKITSDDWEVVQKGKVLQLDEKLNDHNYTTIKFPIQQRDRTLLAGYTIDISERKQAEVELIKHQKLLEESQNIARLGSYIVDFENSSRYWTKEMYSIFGMDDNLPPPAFGEFQSLIHPDDAKYEHDQFIESKQTGSKMDIIYRIITLDGETRYVHEIGTPTFDNNGNVTKIIGSLQDVTEAKLAEEKLQESEARFRNMADTAPVLIWTAGTDKLCDYFNKPWLDFTGRNLAQEIGNGWADNIHPDDFDQCWQTFSSSIDKQETYSQEYRLRRADGVFRWVLDVGVPRFTPEGQFMGFIGTCTDITGIRQAEEKLRDSESRFRALADLLPVGVYQTSILGECQYANQKWLEIAGLSLEDTLGSGWSNALHQEDKENVWAAWNRMVESCGNWGLEYRFKTPDGKITWVYGLATPLLNEKGEISGYIGANMDITERKNMQETLQASLAEKEVLLREVHHRVKNNLAAILGLLDMERQNTADPNAGNLLVDLSNRIKAMSTVHEKLYRSENLSSIDFQDYLKSFLSHLRTSFVSGRDIITKMEAAGIELSLDIAVPCGLIVNELVTNAIKYAFPKGKPGVSGEKHCEISVTIRQEDSTYSLVVSDNGVGLPRNLDWREANSLGLRLVRMLGEHQLGGEIELDKSRGTRFTIMFNTKEREL